MIDPDILHNSAMYTCIVPMACLNQKANNADKNSNNLNILTVNTSLKCRPFSDFSDNLMASYCSAYSLIYLCLCLLLNLNIFKSLIIDIIYIATLGPEERLIL